MSDLQLALIAAGAAAVAGVWGYNTWQERQHRKLAEKIFKGGQPDVLVGEDEKPVPTDADIAEPVDEHPVRLEPAMGDLEPAIGEPLPAEVPVSPEAEGVAAGMLPPPPPEYADEIADCAVRVDFADAVPAPALWAMQARWAEHVVKPLSWLGFDDAGGAWRRLSAHDAGRYATVCAALQLADRQGAVTDAELSAFLDGIREMVMQCAGITELPTQDEVLVEARALDAFCASVDLQLGVNIVARGDPFLGTKLRGVAEAAGLALLDDGSFHARDEAGATRFTLGNLGTELFEAESMRSLATQGVTLSLDVPRVADGPAVFDAMMAAARQLTTALNGALVDAHGSPLSDEMVAGIRAKVAELQQTMARHGIVAGSVRALRLFS